MQIGALPKLITRFEHYNNDGITIVHRRGFTFFGNDMIWNLCDNTLLLPA